MANVDGLRDRLRQYGEAVTAGAGRLLVDELRDAAPVGDTGYLAQSIPDAALVASGDTFTVVVAATADYASYTNDGTDPHRIEGNPLLAFEVNGDDVVVRFVNHPGTPYTGWWDHVIERWGALLADAQGGVAA